MRLFDKIRAYRNRNGLPVNHEESVRELYRREYRHEAAVDVWNEKRGKLSDINENIAMGKRRLSALTFEIAKAEVKVESDELKFLSRENIWLRELVESITEK